MQVEGQQGGCLHSPLATGARVRNAYRTCLILGNSLAKVRLMPDVLESLPTAKQRSLKDLHKPKIVEKYKEDRAALPLVGKQRLGIQVTCQFHLIDQDRKPWATTEKQTILYITMKSLILAQDER